MILFYERALTGGQPNTVLVPFWPKFSAKIYFGFGLSAFFSFGDSAETCFWPKEAVSAEMIVSA